MMSTGLAHTALALLPAVLMLAVVPQGRVPGAAPAWGRLRWLAGAAGVASLGHLALQLLEPPAQAALPLPGLAATLAGAWVAVVVQLLGGVIGVFSSRYLQGEPGQARYVAALGGVLAAVHLLLLADHWLVLIAAWAAVGLAMQHLLCFYPDRPFALLAAHKKRVADRLADGALLAAAALAWPAVGSGSLSALWQHLEAGPASPALQASAVCLALAVALRTALLPLHGWLMQVMEAPTPVSALLHAGVVNLGGFVLIRFAPLLEAAPVARWLLVGLGLATAVLAGLVMLTRVSIKVRLAWSTAAQMGFMVMECGLGLYTLALLHLIGHSLYKAHAFLAASSAVQATGLRRLHGHRRPSVASLVAAPVVALGLVLLVSQGSAIAWPTAAAQTTEGATWGPWPWWWSGVLALAWAPMLWLPSASPAGALGPGQMDAEPAIAQQGLWAMALVAGLTLATLLGHALPLGLLDVPDPVAGPLALVGMSALYLSLAALQARPGALACGRRWSYAGFYLDEGVTRAVLRLWPARWMPATPAATPTPGS